MDKDRKVIDNIFKQARKDLFFPPILKAELADIQTSEIDFSGRRYRILVGKEMVAKLSQKALLGVFHHELNHWAKHPYDAKTVILEDHFLGEIPNKNDIRNLYDDVVVNLDLIINKGLREVGEAYRELPARGKADRLLRAFYYEITGIEFGKVEIEAELRESLLRLLEIDFLNLNRARIKANIRKFAETIGWLVDEEIYLPFSLFSLADFTSEEIKSAIGHIAEELDPQEYKDIVRAVLHVLKESAGISPGKKSLLKDMQRPDIGWYKTRAKRYVIYIEAFSKRGHLYPHELKDFELDDGMDTYSPVESYGKILPGLAKKYSLEEFEGHGELFLRDIVIIVDSSGSMRHPDREISYAVLGAFSVARNYLEHGSNVGVINFSDRNLELKPTSDRDKVYEMLKTYQGGGTTLHIDQLKQYIAEIGRVRSAEEMDYVLITDAGIDNITSVTEYFAKLKGRATIIWVKSDVKKNERFEKNYKLFKEGLPVIVTFVEIEDEKDIPRIAVGKSFGEYAGY
jgi:hypothetical protein